MPQLDRRSFLKVTGSAAAGAVATGCYRYSEIPQKLIPYVVQPEEITAGIATYYASTCTECESACGLHVRTREGRPINIEGNPDHPVNQGAMCSRGLSSIGHTYSPDRYKGPQQDGEPVSWEDALSTLAEKIRANPGGTYALGRDRGPTANGVIDGLVSAAGLGGRVLYDPLGGEALRAATKQVFGVASTPRFDLSKADLVIDFGSDFLEQGPVIEYERQLEEARSLTKHEDGGARIVYVGPRLSLTGSNAEEWIPAKPGTEGILALAIARAAVDAGASGEALTTLARYGAEQAAEQTGVPAETIQRLGRAVAKAKAPVALPPGIGLATRRAVANSAAVLLLNHVAGAQGQTMFVPTPGDAVASHRELSTLVDAMKSGKVSVLLVHDANPLHGLPPELGFQNALAKVPFVASFATSANETSEAAQLVLPDHSPLESWGDRVPRDGVRSVVQPTVAPIFDTRQLEDTLLEVGRALGATVPAGSFREILAEAWSDTDFHTALQNGGVFEDGAPVPPRALAAGAASLEVGEPPLEGDGELVLFAHPHPMLGDGSGANLPWLQEVADPVTHVAWTSWAELHKETAAALDLEHGDVVAVETPAGRVELPVVPRGGVRKDVVAIAMGQGHTVGYYASGTVDGQPGEMRGINVLDLLPDRADENGGPAYLTVRAKVTKTGGFQQLPVWQTDDNKRGRLLGQTVTLAAYAKGEVGAAYPDPHGSGHDDHGDDHHGDEHAADADGVFRGSAGAGSSDVKPDPHLYAPYDESNDAETEYRWSMNIDLDRCSGCNACVIACYIENNIPIVGERQTALGRSMTWLRIERYVTDGEPTLKAGRRRIENGETLGETDVRYSPMMCQQCGSAPCEPVCPVFATYHNEEGLNGMVYNRCIGTRYCANNCSYKVRRFNWYDYQIETWPDPMPLMLNPDVTVRGQGVMEKCTFCVQRIQEARQVAKDEGRLIQDGDIKAACQQCCGSNAIAFGNSKDPNSEVSKRNQDPVRGYRSLHELNTRPAVTYLAKVDRGKVEG